MPADLSVPEVGLSVKFGHNMRMPTYGKIVRLNAVSARIREVDDYGNFKFGNRTGIHDGYVHNVRYSLIQTRDGRSMTRHCIFPADPSPEEMMAIRSQQAEHRNATNERAAVRRAELRERGLRPGTFAHDAARMRTARLSSADGANIQTIPRLPSPSAHSIVTAVAADDDNPVLADMQALARMGENEERRKATHGNDRYSEEPEDHMPTPYWIQRNLSEITRLFAAYRTLEVLQTRLGRPMSRKLCQKIIANIQLP